MKIKNILARITAAVLVVAGVVVTPAGEAKAAEVDVKTSVVYEQRTVSDKAPTKDGYFFGGWFTTDMSKDATGKVITDRSAQTTAYAKFVPAHVLSVKSQNLASTAVGNGTTNTRFLSAVDSADYQKVGFVINTGSSEKEIDATKVYEKVYVTADSQKDYFTASNLFGAGATYVSVIEMGGIPEKAWSDDFYIRPYWVTKDGTKVYGLGKYVRVSDGVGTDKYISVPVSLTTAQAIAAGMLTVNYNTSKLDYVGFVEGRLFDEVAVNGAVDGKVTCVANVSDITANKTADDMYIGLRFKITDSSYKVGNNEFLKFTISGTDFCDKDEKTVSLNVWNFQY